MYSWVEVDLGAVVNNYREIKNFLPKEVRLLAVVKAEAYGHGLVEVGKVLANEGADYLGVTEVAEGITLRRQGITVPILVFGPFFPEEIEPAVEANLTLSIAALDQIRELAALKAPANIQLKLETGLGRTGIKEAELEETIKILHENPQLQLEACYSHLATAGRKNPAYAYQQYKLFQKLKERIKKSFPQVFFHLANSVALQKYPEMHFDMVRAGTLLFGQNNLLKLPLKETWKLKARIIYLNKLPRGSSVGYERGAILKRDTKTAIIPLGFFQGYSLEPRSKILGSKALFLVLARNILDFLNSPRVANYVLLEGKKAPVLGKIGMQQTIIDVTDFPELQKGTVVEINARRTAVNSLPRKYINSLNKQEF